MSKKSSSRIERDAGSGQFVKTGTEEKKPSRTVTEPRKTQKK